MACIEFHPTKIKRLQKFHNLAEDLEWTPNEALGFLGSLWGQVMDLRESGDITGWTARYLAEITGEQSGEPERIWDALFANHWLEKIGERLLVHDWLDYAGHSLRQKYANDNRDKLIDIWALHGKAYADRSNFAPSNSKVDINWNPIELEEIIDNAVYRAKTPVQKVVCTYKIAKGVSWDNRGWDRANYGRASKAASNLIEAFNKNDRQASEWLLGFAKRMRDIGRTWTLETAVKWAWDEQGEREGAVANG